MSPLDRESRSTKVSEPMTVTDPSRAAGHSPSPELVAEVLLARIGFLERRLMGMLTGDRAYSDREVLDGTVPADIDGLWRLGFDAPLCRHHAEEDLRDYIAGEEAEDSVPEITDEPVWLAYHRLGGQYGGCQRDSKA